MTPGGLKLSRPMNKQELVFDWDSAETHRGWKWLSVLIALSGFAFFLGLVSIRFDFKDASSVRSASVMYVSEEKMGASWIRMAEDMGPFPGGLEIEGFNAPIDLLAATSLDDEAAWNPYQFQFRPFRAPAANDRISLQGQRYFPKNLGKGQSGKHVAGRELVLQPVLVPYTHEASKWMPAELPKFSAVMNEKVASSVWRFVLLLRPDGSVAQCLSLSGGREESLSSLVKWLEGLRFSRSEQEERWMGLRVEFLNDMNHGAESE